MIVKDPCLWGGDLQLKADNKIESNKLFMNLMISCNAIYARNYSPDHSRTMSISVRGVSNPYVLNVGT